MKIINFKLMNLGKTLNLFIILKIILVLTDLAYCCGFDCASNEIAQKFNTEQMLLI